MRYQTCKGEDEDEDEVRADPVSFDRITVVATGLPD